MINNNYGDDDDNNDYVDNDYDGEDDDVSEGEHIVVLLFKFDENPSVKS